MRIVRDFQFVEPEDRGAAAAIGNFDGVHIGHQAVIDLARVLSDRSGAPLGIVTFEPHPREVFSPSSPPFRLMNAETKAHRLEKLEIDCLYQLDFNEALSSLTPEEFARNVITNGLGLSHVVVGDDFRFGNGRAGNTADLENFGQEMGFEVTVATLVETDGGQVSSTKIREALSDGRCADAAAMLGHWHRIDGAVLHGEKRGRDLGYPTANMSIEGLHPPRFGVYAVHVDILSGPHEGRHEGVASLGVRPMFGENRANLETYIFDFDGDLYDTHLSVALVEFLRPEVKFETIEDLVTQMDADCTRARDILSVTS